MHTRLGFAQVDRVPTLDLLNRLRHSRLLCASCSMRDLATSLALAFAPVSLVEETEVTEEGHEEYERADPEHVAEESGHEEESRRRAEHDLDRLAPVQRRWRVQEGVDGGRRRRARRRGLGAVGLSLRGRGKRLGRDQDVTPRRPVHGLTGPVRVVPALVPERVHAPPERSDAVDGRRREHAVAHRRVQYVPENEDRYRGQEEETQLRSVCCLHVGRSSDRLRARRRCARQGPATTPGTGGSTSGATLRFRHSGEPVPVNGCELLCIAHEPVKVLGQLREEYHNRSRDASSS